MCLMLGCEMCMHKNTQHGQFCKMRGDLRRTLLESALLHTTPVQEPCDLQGIIKNIFRYLYKYILVIVLQMINL